MSARRKKGSHGNVIAGALHNCCRRVTVWTRNRLSRRTRSQWFLVRGWGGVRWGICPGLLRKLHVYKINHFHNPCHMSSVELEVRNSYWTTDQDATYVVYLKQKWWARKQQGQLPLSLSCAPFHSRISKTLWKVLIIKTVWNVSQEKTNGLSFLLSLPACI